MKGKKIRHRGHRSKLKLKLKRRKKKRKTIRLSKEKTILFWRTKLSSRLKIKIRITCKQVWPKILRKGSTLQVLSRIKTLEPTMKLLFWKTV
jgi:hypothetical protein